MRIVSGTHEPQGVTFDGAGCNVALFSENAERVDLCLFDDAGHETRLTLPGHTCHVWHGYVEGMIPGQKYGFRVYGPYDPKRGHRFNAHKLLVDPYARAMVGTVDYRRPVFGFPHASKNPALFDSNDSASGVPKCVVAESHFDWRNDTWPCVPWERTILYELHAAGFTKRHSEVPEAERGTYLGLTHPSVIGHLRSIGVTSVELMPVFESVSEVHLFERGLTNYWGYSPIGFFAPAQRFASPGRQIVDFKEMVRRFHAEGFEVILDVVYNHTAEGGEHGPTLGLRGVDNAAYYRLQKGNLARYEDLTGCGNTLDVAHPQTLKLICDSLRYWVTEMHVDGFRFDLASTLGRDHEHVDRLAAFFDIVHQDPVLCRMKLIAEPWDLGSDGYQVGNFPVLWSEWNGRYRDTIRRFWKGEVGVRGDMALRLTGSSDLFARSGRRPTASVNFVTSHDGFTLRDLVSYERKHNAANGEENRDGADDNHSYNCGVEGETDDPRVIALRVRSVKNMMATLLLSLGVPMLSMGDELFRTQHGNNNAYAQDNDLAYMPWVFGALESDILFFVHRVARFRNRHAAFCRSRFLRGSAPESAPESAWFRPDGTPMQHADWRSSELGMVYYLAETPPPTQLSAMKKPARQGEAFLICFNPAAESLHVTLPLGLDARVWTVSLDTAETLSGDLSAGDTLVLAEQSMVVLTRVT